MIIIDRQKFSGLVLDQKLAYLLIRSIEHANFRDVRPTPEVLELQDHLLNTGLAAKSSPTQSLERLNG